MRKIDNRLDRSFEKHQPDLVQHQCDEYRNRKQQHDLIHADQQRIHKHLSELFGPHQLVKLLQPHPFTASDAVKDIKVLKGDQYAIQRRIFEEQQKQKTGYQQHIIVPVPPGDSPLACGPASGCGGSALPVQFSGTCAQVHSPPFACELIIPGNGERLVEGNLIISGLWRL
ncbi:hypothetical protein D3C73_1131530 [compost metagenome]